MIRPWHCPMIIKEISFFALSDALTGILEEDNQFILKMAEKGVATNVHYKPLPMHTAYIYLGFDIKDYPNAYNLYKNQMTLPLHTCLTDDDVEYVLDAFAKTYEEMK